MKQRLDVYLNEKKFFESREKARTMIMAGEIFVNNQSFLKIYSTINI